MNKAHAMKKFPELKDMLENAWIAENKKVSDPYEVRCLETSVRVHRFENSDQELAYRAILAVIANPRYHAVNIISFIEAVMDEDWNAALRHYRS